MRSGTCAPIAETTRSTSSSNASTASHLNWLSQQIGEELLDAIIITTGTETYRRRDGIAVVPAALLGP